MKGDRIYKAALIEAAKENADLDYVYRLLGEAKKKQPYGDLCFGNMVFIWKVC